MDETRVEQFRSALGQILADYRDVPVQDIITELEAALDVLEEEADESEGKEEAAMA